VFGEKPIGFLTYTSDGRMTVIITHSTRRPPASAKATEAEAAHLYGTMVAYAGTYRINGDKIIHHIEASWNEAWNGTDQERFAEVKNNRLTIYSPPFVSPPLAGGSIRSWCGSGFRECLVWVMGCRHDYVGGTIGVPPHNRRLAAGPKVVRVGPRVVIWARILALRLRPT